MKSVLNESTLGDMFKAVKEFVSGNKKRSTTKTYLNGSISRFTKNLIMTFPVLCDSSVPIETATMISKANESRVADLLKMLFASINLEALKGDSAADIIQDLYRGLDPNMDINELIDILDSIADSGGRSTDAAGARFEQARIIREMVEELKKIKPFPKESLSESSIGDYVVKQAYNTIVVSEAPYRGSVYDPYVGGYTNPAPNPDEDDEYSDIDREPDNGKADRMINIQKARDTRKQNKKENKRNKEMDKWKRDQDEAKFDRDLKNDMDRRQNDMINQHNNMLSASDVKKANELQPLLINVNFNIVERDASNVTRIVDKKSFIAGIKSRLIPVEGMDIIERFAAKNRTALTLKNLIRATTGEISFIKDFILCLDQTKLDAKNAAKSGPLANVWHILEKRGAKNNLNKLKKKGNDATCITSVVLSRESVNYMKMAYKFDIEDFANARMIMDSFNILALFIADEATQTVQVMYDGYAEFETLAYVSLDRELSDRNYRKAINMINQIGR